MTKTKCNVFSHTTNLHHHCVYDFIRVWVICLIDPSYVITGMIDIAFSILHWLIGLQMPLKTSLCWKPVSKPNLFSKIRWIYYFTYTIIHGLDGSQKSSVKIQSTEKPKGKGHMQFTKYNLLCISINPMLNSAHPKLQIKHLAKFCKC